jgi:hypothetical protein
MTSAPFIVELPQHNFDREGTLADIRLSLERLIHVSTAIFERIETKVQAETKRLDGIESRISSCQRKVSHIASQPSEAWTLVCSSKLPNFETIGRESIFSDLPVQRLSEGESDESRFKNRKNVNDDDDPAVPYEALVDLDKKITAQTKLVLRDASNVLKEAEEEPSCDWWWSLARENESNKDNFMGPAPPSLRNSTAFIDDHHAPEPKNQDVGYKPRTKEAHQLGLPTNLGDLLPDIAKNKPLFRLESEKRKAQQVPETSTLDKSGLIESSARAELYLGNEPSAKRKESAPPKESIAEVESQPPPLAVSPITVSDESQHTFESSKLAASIPGTEDPLRSALLASIRETRLLQKTKSTDVDTAESSKVTGKKPVSLADEMREKLARRQQVLSGERDDEEQEAERKRRQGRDAVWSEGSSDSDSSVPSFVATGGKKPSSSSGKRQREKSKAQPAQKAAPFAGLDALLNRELASKSSIVPKPPPKPASSVGDWDD